MCLIWTLQYFPFLGAVSVRPLTTGNMFDEMVIYAISSQVVSSDWKGSTVWSLEQVLDPLRRSSKLTTEAEHISRSTHLDPEVVLLVTRMLLGTSASLLVTSALLVVTRSYSNLIAMAST